jgi:hypothetical protein
LHIVMTQPGELPPEVAAPLGSWPPLSPPPRTRRARTLRLIAGAAGLLVAGFVLGQHTITSPEQAMAKMPPPAPALPHPAAPLPDLPPLAPATADNGAAALAQQLQQPPRIVPPPGASSSGKNPFGLSD